MTHMEKRSEHFRFFVAPSSTKASAIMLNDKRYDHIKVGERVEVCPETTRFSREIAHRISQDGGCALYIDYGQDRILNDSLRVGLTLSSYFIKK